MSDENTQNPAAEAAETDTLAAAIASLNSKYEKRNRLALISGDNQDAFLAFLDQFGEDDPIVDWSQETPEGYNTLALVKAENGDNRLLAIASPEIAFADPAVRDWAYKYYVRAVMQQAAGEDATAAQFAQPSGMIKPRYDQDAFKHVARSMVRVLRHSNLAGVTVGNLKEALRNAAYAASMFPKVTAEQWGKVFDVMSAAANKAGFNTAIFDFWRATRDRKPDTSGEFTLDFSDFDVD